MGMRWWEPETVQRSIDEGLERSEVESQSVWPYNWEDEFNPAAFIGPVLPHLCEACGGAIYRDEMTFWSHVWPLPVELGHTAVPEPF
jgi:hypothetical protein